MSPNIENVNFTEGELTAGNVTDGEGDVYLRGLNAYGLGWVYGANFWFNGWGIQGPVACFR